jgi:hypothetical protein
MSVNVERDREVRAEAQRSRRPLPVAMTGSGAKLLKRQ